MKGQTDRRFAIGIGVSIVAATLVGLLVRNPPMIGMYAWGSCVAISLIGYGSLAARFAFPGKRLPLALLASVGAGALVALGSVVTATRVMRPWLGIALVLVGCACALPRLASTLENAWAKNARRLRYGRRLPFLALLTLVPLVLIGLAYTHGAVTIALNAYDDELAYMTFPKQMLETGSFADPFSLRRVAAYGGQPFLHALLLSNGELVHIGILDRGIFFSFALLHLRELTFENRRPPFIFTLAAMVVFIFLQNTSINMASHYSGIASFIALYRLLKLGEAEFVAADSWHKAARLAVPYALLATFLCTLRQNFVPTVALVFLAHILGTKVRAHGGRAFVLAVCTAVLGLAFLAGWIVQMRQSSGTALFPLQPGYLRPAFTMRSPTMTPGDEARFIWASLVWHEPFPGWPLALLAMPLSRVLRREHTIITFAAASMIGYVFLAHSFTLSSAENFARYSFPFVMATLFLAAFALASSGPAGRVIASRRATTTASPYVLGAIVGGALLLGQAREFLRLTYQNTVHLAFAGHWRPEVVGRYAHAQSVVPENASILVMVDEPYNFNYARNRIYNLDVPGALSPPPGLPFFGPVAEWKQYFATQGIRYITFIRPTQSRGNYVRPYWFRRFFHEDEIWRRHAPYYIYAFDALEELAKPSRILFEELGLVVIDLERE